MTGHTEEWRQIVGFDGYEVSNLGRVRSYKHNKVRHLIPDEVKGRYLRVTLSRDGKIARFFVHLLVMAAFIGPRPVGMYAAHGNGDAQDNRAENLRWATRHENEMDKRKHGTCQRGQRNPMARLTTDAVLCIRSEPKTPLKELAGRYGVNVNTIKKVRYGRTWGHLMAGGIGSE